MVKAAIKVFAKKIQIYQLSHCFLSKNLCVSLILCSYVQRGIYFEIKYSDFLSDAQKGMRVISNAKVRKFVMPRMIM